MVKMSNRANAEKLAKQPYTTLVTLDKTTDDEKIYFARALEVEGCFGQGDTPDEARYDLQLAMVDFIESLLDDGIPIPEPTRLVHSAADRSGVATYKFIVRGSTMESVKDTPQDSYLFSAQV